MGRGRNKANYSGGGGKYCKCGHEKKYHIKKKLNCTICNCESFNKTEEDS